MRIASGRAPSKLILLGEHAVVYGHPAFAVPLAVPGAEAQLAGADRCEPVVVHLEDFKIRWEFGLPEPAGELLPFSRLISSFLKSNPKTPKTGWRLSIRSRIPIGCGLGSGAAVATAALRALDEAFGVERSPKSLSDEIYKTEKILHGTPSGIDNTVIAIGRPVLFRKGKEFESVPAPNSPLHLVVGDTGIRHQTVEVVSDVRNARKAAAGRYDSIFAEIGEITLKGVQAFKKGAGRTLGKAMNENQGRLAAIGVSSREIDALISAALDVGALGAKLCGAGRGGCVAALAESSEGAERVKEAFKAAGAKTAFVTGILGQDIEACARS